MRVTDPSKDAPLFFHRTFKGGRCVEGLLYHFALQIDPKMRRYFPRRRDETFAGRSKEGVALKASYIPRSADFGDEASYGTISSKN